jgi:hypothetical protein
MTEKVSNNLEYDIPVFTSLGMKVPENPIENGSSGNKNSNLSDIDITALYQKEPFESEDKTIRFSKTSFLLIFLVFIIILYIIIIYYK